MTTNNLQHERKPMVVEQLQQTDWARRVRERIYHTIETAHVKGTLKGELMHLQMAGSLAADIAVSKIDMILDIAASKITMLLQAAEDK
ncbi:MAG: hypothetical protein JRI80_00370 [Deltaproteobacteria bacterium]|nr:hypothetical protein [Deltaproteobacteria bacterium]